MVLSDQVQLGYALEAFCAAHALTSDAKKWATQKLFALSQGGISSMSDLATGVKEGTVNLDLELFGVESHHRFTQEQLELLQSFLPGPRGFRCFRLAQLTAEKVKAGTADTEYVHRPESGKMGDEQFHVPVNDDWTLHVDCAGFVRNVLRYVNKNPFRMALSDRDFMRAKDFYRFFEQQVKNQVTDPPLQGMEESNQTVDWRIVPDLRLVIPGDIIVYRAKGNAAGGAAFTKTDREDLRHVLRATYTAQLWRKEEKDQGRVTRNMAKDPRVKPWVEAAKKRLHAVGIDNVKQLKGSLNEVNDMLIAKGESPFSTDEISLFQECLETTALNTGHIVFASGPALLKGDNEYRLRVVHSTKHGKIDSTTGEPSQGIEEYYRRFTMIQEADGTVSWTRKMKQADPLSDDEDDPADDMEDDSDDEEEENNEKDTGDDGGMNDDMAGQEDVQVIVARMCF